MFDREAAEKFIKKQEALRLFVYDDADGQPIVPGKLVKGHPTIGWGRCLDTTGISTQEAEILFEADFNRTISILENILCPPIWREKAERITALLSMAYNLGAQGFKAFKNMIAAVNSRAWKEAAKHARDSFRWREQLRTRAEKEAQMLETD